MGKTIIEKFAEDNLGIVLTEAQVEMLQFAADGKVLIRGRMTGQTTAKRVAQEWLKHGLETS